MERKSRSFFRIGITATTIISLIVVAALAYFALNWLGLWPDFSPHIRPFRTEKGGFAALSPDGKKLVDLVAEDHYTKIPGTDQYNTIYTSTLTLRQIDNWQPLYMTVYYEDIYVFFTPDGQSLVVVGEHSIEWRSMISGALTRKLAVHVGCCRIAFSPDWTMLAATGQGSNSDTVLFSLNDGRVIRTIQGGPGDEDVAFSPDGQLLATAGFGTAASKNYAVRLWRVSDGTEVRTLVRGTVGHGFWEGRLKFSPNGQLIASTDWDGNVRLWRVSDGALLHTLEFGPPPLLDVNFSPDSKLIVASGAYDWGKLWRVSDGSLVADLANEKDRFGSGGSLGNLQFSPDGKILYGSADRTVRMWHVP